MLSDSRNWKNINEVSDFPEGFDLEEACTSTLEWFDDRRTVPTEEFIDRFCKDHSGTGDSPDDWDMDRYDSPAAKAILKTARRIKREQGD